MCSNLRRGLRIASRSIGLYRYIILLEIISLFLANNTMYHTGKLYFKECDLMYEIVLWRLKQLHFEI